MSYFPPVFRLTPTDAHTLIHWTLDETAVPFASTGSNTSLDLIKGFGPTNIIPYRTGLFAQACEFIPASSATTGDTAVTPPGNSLTVSCWVFCRSFPNPSAFVGKTYDITGTSWASPFWSIALFPTTGGVFSSGYNIAATFTQQDGPSTDVIPLNAWCFLAVTFDGVTFKQYLNGNLIQSSSALSASIDWGNGGPWCVGGNNLEQSNGHDGFIDDVRIESVPRSQEYLEQQYKDGIGFFENTVTAGFVPTDVGGAVLWLRSDFGTRTISDKVATLVDQTFYDSNAVQATAGDRPLLVEYGANDHPFLKFDTAKQWLTGALAAANTLTDLTFFLVVRFADTADRTAFELTDSSYVGPSGLHVVNQSSPANTLLIERHASGGDQSTAVPSDTAGIKIYAATGSAAGLQGYVDGVAAGTPAGSTTGLAAITNYVVGAEDNTGTNEMVGSFYELLVFDRVLAGDELTKVTNYLKKKYGYAVSAFTPTDIPGLLAWYDSEHTTLVTGDVDVLIDRSGLANDGTAPSGPQRPTVNTADAQYAGHDSLSWSSVASTSMTSPSLTYGTFTMVMVAKVTSSPTYIWADNLPDYFYSGVSFTSYTPVRDGSNYSAFDVLAGANWAKSEVPRIFTRRFDGTSAGDILRVNKIEPAVNRGASGDPGTATTSAQFSVLSYTGGTSSSDATFGAILFFDNAISDDNLALLEDYLIEYYGLWNPTFIADCTAWFRADLGMTLVGPSVALWADQSGAAIEPALAPTGAAPQWEASGINGLPDITFDGSTQFLSGTDALLGTTGITLFGIFQTTRTTTQFIWGMQYNDYHYAIFTNSDATHPGQLFFFDGAAHSITSPLNYSDGSPHAFIGTYDSGSGDMVFYVDDGTTPVGTATGAGTISNGVHDLNSVGSSTGVGGNDRVYLGSVAEVGAFNRALTADEVARLMQYLKARAGI